MLRRAASGDFVRTIGTKEIGTVAGWRDAGTNAGASVLVRFSVDRIRHVEVTDLEFVANAKKVNNTNTRVLSWVGFLVSAGLGAQIGLELFNTGSGLSLAAPLGATVFTALLTWWGIVCQPRKTKLVK
jgi:hypothetical protein